MQQIRNLAISGVDSLGKVQKVCETTGSLMITSNDYNNINTKGWIIDTGLEFEFVMDFSSNAQERSNFKNCTQMTYEEFLEKYDNKEIKQIIDNPDVNSLANKSDKDGDFELTYGEHQNAKRVMEKDSEPDKTNTEKIMNKEQMKELYESEPDKWVVYLKRFENNYTKLANPDWSSKGYSIVKKEHEEIWDKKIANPDTKVTFLGLHGEETCIDFLNNYNPNGATYRLAKPQCDGNFNGCTCDIDCQCESHFYYKKSSNFNGGYIKASQEAYDLLVKNDYKPLNNKTVDCIDFFFWIKDNKMIGTFDDIPNNKAYKEKQFYINNGKLSWDEPIRTSSNEDLNELPTTGEEVPFVDNAMEWLENSTKQTISIASDENIVSSDGGSNTFFAFPSWVVDVDCLCRYWQLSSAEGNVLKSLTANLGSRHDGTDKKRETKKCLHYAIERRLWNGFDRNDIEKQVKKHFEDKQ